jgi:hypothetical protein
VTGVGGQVRDSTLFSLSHNPLCTLCSTS